MRIQVILFANIKELLGCKNKEVDLPHGQTVAHLCRQLVGLGDQWAALFGEPSAQLKVAVNQRMASWDTELRDDDEVAFFPPVTGG